MVVHRGHNIVLLTDDTRTATSTFLFQIHKVQPFFLYVAIALAKAGQEGP